MKGMKTAVITGASRGIGKATALAFLSAGWRVIGTSRSGEGWAHERLAWVSLELSDPGSIARAAERISEKGPIHALVNNAGLFERIDRERPEIQVAVLRRTLEVNLIGTIDLTEKLIPLVEERGHVVFLGSRLGSITEAESPTLPAYSISKAGLGMYARRLAARLKDKNITVSIIDPGWVKTDLSSNGAHRNPEEPAREILELVTSEVPTGRFWKEGRERAW